MSIDRAFTSDANPSNDVRWEASTDETEMAERLLSEVHRLRWRQRARREMYRFFLELYGVTETAQLGLTSFESASSFQAPTMPFNVVRRGIKTVHAKCAKNRPLPMVLATRGDYSANKRARGLTNFLGGLFTHLKVPETSRVGCLYALTCGTGINYVWHQKGDKFPRIEPILPWEFYVAPADARYGTPKRFYFARWIDRAELIERYPDKADLINSNAGNDTMPNGQDGMILDEAEVGDLVLVYYGWRCKTGDNEDAKPGKMCIAVSGGVLESADYDKHYPPFAFLRYSKPLIGFYGEGLAAEMAGFQYELNYTTDTLRMGHRTAAGGLWVTDDNTGVPDTYWSNEIGYVIKKRPGSSIEYYNPTPTSEQTYHWHEMLSDGALSWSGISGMSANAEKPPGVDAAVALQTLDDIESDNFAIFQQDYEAFHLDLANLLIDEMKEMAEENPEMAILVQDRRSVVNVVWKDVDMARDAILLQTFPVALLGRTPAARRQQVADLFKDGVIDRALYLKLLDAPDIDSEVDLDSATRTLVDEQIDHMLDADDTEDADAYVHPMPYTDLVYALRRATQQVCLGTLQKRPDANLALLRQYIEECKGSLEKQKEVPQGDAAAPPPPGMPPGAMPPPMPGQGGGMMPPGAMGAAPPGGPNGVAPMPPGMAPGGVMPQ